jgi:DNA helicase TIP49 (TBP-interacting protein)
MLENFHYLPESVQKRFAFDLRAFQELGVRFILGVWRERNRLLQFNGDLLDRVQEIPVEPWEDEDFVRIVRKGEELLNIKLSEGLLEKCIQLSFQVSGFFKI